jgi:hypothetical protein
VPIQLPIVLNAADWPVIQFGLAWAFMQMPVLSYAVAANLPSILARRCKRARFQRLLARRTWPAVTCQGLLLFAQVHAPSAS